MIASLYNVQRMLTPEGCLVRVAAALVALLIFAIWWLIAWLLGYWPPPAGG